MKQTCISCSNCWDFEVKQMLIIIIILLKQETILRLLFSVY